MDKCIFNGKIINSFDIAADIDLEMEIRQCKTLQCCDPDCSVQVRYKHGKIRVPHFAHIVTNQECDYDRYSSKKSDVFKKVQQQLYDVLKRKYPKAVDIDTKIIKEPSHFTPIILIGSHLNFAIDITDKRITANKLQSRKETYAACGYMGIQIVIDEAMECEYSESYDFYLPVRYELNKSANNAAVIYDKVSEKYYYLRYDKNDYGNKFSMNNVISREFNISELTITEQGISVPRLDKEFSEWVEAKKKNYQKQLESLKRAKQQTCNAVKPIPKTAVETKAAEVVMPTPNETVKISKSAFDPVEYHKQTGKYAGNVVKGVRESLNLNEIHINKGAPNYYKVFSDSEIESMINDAFSYTISSILRLMNKMYHANNDEKAAFVQIYEEYLNSEQTEEVIERLKILEYAIAEAEIFR